METKEFSNVEKNKKGNGISKEAAAGVAGLAGVAGAAAGGVAGASFGDGKEEAPAPSKPDENIAQNAQETTQQQTEATAQTVVEPDEVPFSDPAYQQTAQQQPQTEAQNPVMAEVNVDEIVDEIIGIEEVEDPLVAEVVDYEDYGVIYTEDGEEIPADVLAMEDVQVVSDPDSGEQPLAEVEIIDEPGLIDTEFEEGQFHGVDSPEDDFSSFDPMADVIS